MEYRFSEKEYKEYIYLKNKERENWSKALEVHRYLKKKFPGMIKETYFNSECIKIQRDILNIKTSSFFKTNLNSEFVRQIDYYNLTIEIEQILKILNIDNIVKTYEEVEV